MRRLVFFVIFFVFFVVKLLHKGAQRRHEATQRYFSLHLK